MHMGGGDFECVWTYRPSTRCGCGFYFRKMQPICFRHIIVYPHWVRCLGLCTPRLSEKWICPTPFILSQSLPPYNSFGCLLQFLQSWRQLPFPFTEIKWETTYRHTHTQTTFILRHKQPLPCRRQTCSRGNATFSAPFPTASAPSSSIIIPFPFTFNIY